MKVLVYKTNINSKPMVETIESMFVGSHSVAKLSVDTEDVDNVLRIEGVDDLNERKIAQMIQNKGFNCEVLNY